MPILNEGGVLQIHVSSDDRRLIAVVLGAALELEPVVARHRWILPALAFAQLLTIFLTFHFQELRQVRIYSHVGFSDLLHNNFHCL